jgi:TolB protein
MYEDDEENDDLQETKSRTWPTKVISSCLVVVMLCTITATPIAVAYRYYEQWRVSRESSVDDGSTSGRVNRIAYVSDDRQLVTSAPDGTDVRKLSAEGAYQFPAWSPDGSEIAIIGGSTLYSFQDRDGAEESGAYGILYQDEVDQPFYLYWAPDGQKLSFLTNHADSLALQMASAGSALESRILATGQPFYWDWDPNGDDLLLHSGIPGEETRLALLNSNSGTFGESIAEAGLFQAPGISVDGHYWAYAQIGSDGGNHLTILSASDGRETVLESVPGMLAMGWSPLDNLLAYTSAGDRSHAFYGPMHLVNADTGDRLLLVNDTVIAFFWSPDGRSIAYFKFADPVEDSVQVNFETSSRFVLSKPAVQQNRIRLELWVASISSGESTWLATFEPPGLYMSQFLPFFDQYALSHRIWSPESDALVLPMVDSDGPWIYIVSADGDEILPVARGQIGFWSHQ